MPTDFEVRRWNPAHDETEWIVIEKGKSREGWPEYTARLPYAHLDKARLFAAAPDLLAACEAALPVLEGIRSSQLSLLVRRRQERLGALLQGLQGSHQLEGYLVATTPDGKELFWQVPLPDFRKGLEGALDYPWTVKFSGHSPHERRPKTGAFHQERLYEPDAYGVLLPATPDNLRRVYGMMQAFQLVASDAKGLVMALEPEKTSNVG